MSEPEPTPSLIQQRLALQRATTAGWWAFASPVVMLFVFIALITDGRDGWISWLASLVGIIGAVIAFSRLRAARRDVREFESRYGRDAGIQE